MKVKPPRHRVRCKSPDLARRKLWRIVEGSVDDALKMHPDYLLGNHSLWTVKQSITKRVVGNIMGFVEQSTRGR